MRVEETQEYKDAIAALTRLKAKQGSNPDLKAIALFIIKVSELPVTESVLRFIGNGSEQDEQVIQAYQETLKATVLGEDDDND